MRWPSLPKLVVGGAALGTALFALFLGDAPITAEEGKPIVSSELRFEDRLDGAVAVYRGGAETPSAMLPPNSGHFIRATLRSLVRDRRLQETGAGGAIPFRLTLWPDGRLILEDPATARMLDLRAFGETNAQSFAQLLPPPEMRR